jgi:site-specific recombinase XerD
MTQDSKRAAKIFSKNCKIPEELRAKQDVLPTEYERYLDYYRIQVRRMHSVWCMRQILSSLNFYLQKSNIALCKISIEQVDQFLALYNENYATATCRVHRSYLREFLKYLYRNAYVKKNLAPLVKSPPVFARSKPPKFLRAKEVEKLFGSLDLCVSKDLRTYATMHLAYYLGLRPREISLITLDDISFRQKEIFIRSRKNYSPAYLPLPDDTIKAITAYIIGGRPKSECRTLFLQLVPPYNPVNSEKDITHYIRDCMQKNNLSASTYWLRHSYAQNLLESGASIYEIKEMMGHKSMGSTGKYLSIHINLMREIILDETL